MDDAYKTGVQKFDEVFEFLTGDVCWEDHGGSWFRKVSNSRFHVVRIFNWEVETGEGSGYNVDLVEVDTDDLDRLHPALESCGYAVDADSAVYVPYSGDVLCEGFDFKRRRLIFCECMHGYGSYAPIDDESGEKFEPLFLQMVKRSIELTEDEDAYEAAMNNPVNAIGSTAREYQQGDINSAIMRGLNKGDEKAAVMAVIHYGRDNLDQVKELAKLTHGEE